MSSPSDSPARSKSEDGLTPRCAAWRQVLAEARHRHRRARAGVQQARSHVLLDQPPPGVPVLKLQQRCGDQPKRLESGSRGRKQRVGKAGRPRNGGRHPLSLSATCRGERGLVEARGVETAQPFSGWCAMTTKPAYTLAILHVATFRQDADSRIKRRKSFPSCPVKPPNRHREVGGPAGSSNRASGFAPGAEDREGVTGLS